MHPSSSALTSFYKPPKAHHLQRKVCFPKRKRNSDPQKPSELRTLPACAAIPSRSQLSHPFQTGQKFFVATCLYPVFPKHALQVSRNSILLGSCSYSTGSCSGSVSSMCDSSKSNSQGGLGTSLHRSPLLTRRAGAGSSLECSGLQARLLVQGPPTQSNARPPTFSGAPFPTGEGHPLMSRGHQLLVDRAQCSFRAGRQRGAAGSLREGGGRFGHEMSEQVTSLSEPAVRRKRGCAQELRFRTPAAGSLLTTEGAPHHGQMGRRGECCTAKEGHGN